MSDQVRTPEDRFSHVTAQMKHVRPQSIFTILESLQVSFEHDIMYFWLDIK